LSKTRVDTHYFLQLKVAGVLFTEAPAQHGWGIAVGFKDLYGNGLYIPQPTQ
jgi:hypothetical protein